MHWTGHQWTRRRGSGKKGVNGKIFCLIRYDEKTRCNDSYSSFNWATIDESVPNCEHWWTVLVPLNVYCQRLQMHIIEIIEAIEQASVNQMNLFFIFTRLYHFVVERRDEKGSINTKDNKAQINWCYEMQSKAKWIKSDANGAWMWFDEKGINAKHNKQCTLCRQQFSQTHTCEYK